MDYTQGKIYKIIDETNGDVYIGSTRQTLKMRYKNHELFRNRYNKLKQNCKIILVENYPCSSRRELEEREQYYIDNTDCINKKRAYSTLEQTREKNKQRHEIWKKNNKEKHIQKQKECAKRLRFYQKTWGGRTDQNNNSLLKIDPDLFTSE